MKKTVQTLQRVALLIAATGLIAVQPVLAQEDTERINSPYLDKEQSNEPDMQMVASTENDTMKFSFRNTQVLIITDSNTIDSIKTAKKEEEERNQHWAGFYLGVGGYMTSDNSTTLPDGNDHLELRYAESITWSLNFLEQDIRLADDFAKIVTGMGISFHHYSFANNTVLQTDPANNDELTFFNDTIRSLDRNKLKTSYLNVPLMLAFNTSKNRKKAFHIAAGVIGSYRIGSRYKLKYEQDGDVNKDMIKADFNQNPFQLSATTRVGYGRFNLFATYALTPLFESGTAPELYPFSVGIQLVSF